MHRLCGGLDSAAVGASVEGDDREDDASGLDCDGKFTLRQEAQELLP